LFHRPTISLGLLLLTLTPLTVSAQNASEQLERGTVLAMQGEPRQDPATWFTDLDYPYEAKRAGVQGTVSMELSIDTTGHVAGCRIAASSGSTILDESSCWLVMRRGRFTIERGASGDARPYTYTISKTWSLSSK